MRVLALFCLLLPSCLHAQDRAADKPAAKPQQNNLVILDIGHSLGSGGAQSPDKRVSECRFWYTYVGDIKAALENDGYRVIVCNRAKAPKDPHFADLAKKLQVVHLNDPDTGKRYPSRYHPDRIGAGMVCADYGIEQRPACMVFLHLNCYGSQWRNSASNSIVMHNKLHGAALGTAISDALNREIFNRPGGIDNKGKACRPMVRTEKALGGAGWLNTLDDEGIPAAVVEAVFTDDSAHVNYICVPENARKLARTIAHGISAWLKAR